MLVAWKYFKDLNSLKIVAIVFSACSDITNTWRLCVFMGLIWISESRVTISVSSFKLLVFMGDSVYFLGDGNFILQSSLLLVQLMHNQFALKY
jgi:hypothetical protein